MSDVIISLGNVAPHVSDLTKVEALAVGGAPHPSVMIPLSPLIHHTTTVHCPAEDTPEKIVANVAMLWGYHSAQPPSWILIEADRSPEDLAAIESGIRAVLRMAAAPNGPVALITNGGIDFAATQLSGAASATAVAKWIALTANSTAPNAADTTLAGEIATASGGLVRAAATYAHTNSTTTYTLTNTFTANGSDVLPVTVAKAGVFTATSSGTMVFETLLSATATLTASGDNVALTWTITV